MVHLLLAIIYISFISLGLPDGLLGAGWPTMYLELGVPVSYAGAVSMTIAMGTIISSLLSDWMTHKLGSGKVTAISVGMTAAALLGFSCADSYWMLILWAIPYGLGAGGVDASLNNYVALHYSARHMSWLHCMWGIGASVGPYVMGYILTGGGHWTAGYRSIGLLQAVLTVILVLSLPLWKKRPGVDSGSGENGGKPLTIPQILRIPGAREIMVSFFCYCALEATASLWASSYLVLYKGMSAERGAFFASMIFIGITGGRAVNGFLTMKLSDTQLIRLGEGIVLAGLAAMLLPLGQTASIIGLILIGLGCAPIYPCIIHSTPAHFGPERSQAIIGVQMASAYIGSCLMPPLFGLIADHITVALMPVYLLVILVLMFVMYEQVVRKTAH